VFYNTKKRYSTLLTVSVTSVVAVHGRGKKATASVSEGHFEVVYEKVMRNEREKVIRLNTMTVDD